LKNGRRTKRSTGVADPAVLTLDDRSRRPRSSLPFAVSVLDSMETIMFLQLARRIVCSLAFTCVLGVYSHAQSLTVTKLSGDADYAVTLDGSSVAFIGSANGPSQFSVEFGGDVPTTVTLTIGADFAHVTPDSVGDSGFANPLIMSRDDEVSFVFVSVPSEDAGQTLDPNVAASWQNANSAWFAGRFG
jgi:hypothetical protein